MAEALRPQKVRDSKIPVLFAHIHTHTGRRNHRRNLWTLHNQNLARMVKSLSKEVRERNMCGALCTDKSKLVCVCVIERPD